MAKTAEKSSRKQQGGSASATVCLKLDLPKSLVNRLEILSEPHGGDLTRTLVAAVELLWQNRYTPSLTVSPGADEKAQHALARHNEGVPVEDIARELELSEEHVKALLHLEDARPQRDILKERAATLQAIGVGLGGIAKQWNDEGVPILSGQGKWHHSMIRKLLQE